MKSRTYIFQLQFSRLSVPRQSSPVGERVKIRIREKQLQFASDSKDKSLSHFSVASNAIQLQITI